MFFYSYILSRKILTEFKPHIVIGTGGYSSGIPMLIAIQKGMKTVIQEQNSFPGITNRMLGKKIDVACVAYEEAKKYFSNAILTGNPIRKNISIIEKNVAKKRLKLDMNKPVLAIIGGSQGSMPLNNHFINNINHYKNLNVQIIWQCGK